MVCGAVNVFDRGTSEVIVALDAVATEATKPLVGVFLDFHAPVTSGRHSRPSRRPAPVRRARRRDPGLVGAVRVRPLARPRSRCRAAARRRRADRQAGGEPGAGGRVRRDGSSPRPRRQRCSGRTGSTIVPRFRVASLDEACQVAERLGWDVVLKATAKAVRGRPDLASVSPKHRRSRGDGLGLGRSGPVGPRPRPAGRRRPHRGGARGPGDGPARRRAGDRQPRRTRRSARSSPSAWRAFRASCWATSSIGCRR